MRQLKWHCKEYFVVIVTGHGICRFTDQISPSAFFVVDASADSGGLSEWESAELSVSDRPDLASAKIVISGGSFVLTCRCFISVLFDLKCL